MKKIQVKRKPICSKSFPIYLVQLVYQTSFTQPIKELRSCMGDSIRSTVSFLSPFLARLKEHSRTLSMPPSLPQISATDGGFSAAKTVTDKVPYALSK